MGFSNFRSIQALLFFEELTLDGVHLDFVVAVVQMHRIPALSV
jgi:hypothetical protein